MNDEWNILLDRLTKDGHDWLDTDAGKVLAERQGLLPQLRAAVFAGMENTGGSSAFGSKPPLDAGAIDLLDEITDQATQVLAAVDPHPTPYGTAESYIRLWAGQTTQARMFTIKTKQPIQNFVYDKTRPERVSVFDELAEYSALELMRRWSSRVEDFFNPPDTSEVTASCPVCGERYVHRMKDGQWIQVSALNIIRDRETGESREAKCGACGTSWLPDKFEFLAGLVGVTEAAEVVEHVEKDKAHVESEACFEGRHTRCEVARCQCICHTEADHDPLVLKRAPNGRIVPATRPSR